MIFENYEPFKGHTPEQIGANWDILERNGLVRALSDEDSLYDHATVPLEGGYLKDSFYDTVSLVNELNLPSEKLERDELALLTNGGARQYRDRKKRGNNLSKFANVLSWGAGALTWGVGLYHVQETANMINQYLQTQSADSGVSLAIVVSGAASVGAGILAGLKTRRNARKHLKHPSIEAFKGLQRRASEADDFIEEYGALRKQGLGPVD